MTDHARALRDIATDEPRAAQRGIMEQAADEIERLRCADPWRDAVDEALAVCMLAASDDPRESLRRLIDWHCAVALDPQVSEAAQALLFRAFDDADVLAEYAGKDGRRDWVNVGVWLRPGEVIMHCDDPRPRQASGETTGYAGGTAP